MAKFKYYEMKTSELIKMLTKKKKEWGDIPVRFVAETDHVTEADARKYGSTIPIGGVTTIVGGKGKGQYNMIADTFTLAEMDN